MHIPLRELPAGSSELPDGQTLVVCKVGGRSAQAGCTSRSRASSGQPRRRHARLGGRRPADGQRDEGRPRRWSEALSRRRRRAAGAVAERTVRRSGQVVAGAGHRRPRRATRGGRWRHCTSSSRSVGVLVAEQVDQPDQRDLRGVASRGGTSTRRRTGRRSRRRTARRRARRPARPPPSAPSPARAAGCTPSRICSSIQAPGAARVGAAVDHLVERGVDPDLEAPHRLAQRAGDPQPVERQHPALAPGDHHSIGRRPAPSDRHREQPAAVGRQQRARLEVGARCRPGRRPAAVRRRRRRGRPSPCRAARWAWAHRKQGTVACPPCARVAARRSANDDRRDTEHGHRQHDRQGAAPHVARLAPELTAALRARGAAPRDPRRRPAAAGAAAAADKQLARAARRRRPGDPRGDREPRPLRRRAGLRDQPRRPGHGGRRDPRQHHRAGADPVPDGRRHRAPARLRPRRPAGPQRDPGLHARRGRGRRRWCASAKLPGTPMAHRDRAGLRPAPRPVIAAEVASELVTKVAGKRIATTVGAGCRWSAAWSARARTPTPPGRSAATPTASSCPAPGGRPPAPAAARRLRPAASTSRRFTRNHGPRDALELLVGRGELAAQPLLGSRCAGRTSASSVTIDSIAASATSSSSGWSGSTNVASSYGAGRRSSSEPTTSYPRPASSVIQAPRQLHRPAAHVGGQPQPRGARCRCDSVRWASSSRTSWPVVLAGQHPWLTGSLIRRTSAVSGTPSEGLARLGVGGEGEPRRARGRSANRFHSRPRSAPGRGP